MKIYYGTILESGMILCDNGKEYEPDRIYGDTILLACYSWARQSIKDVVGKRVDFIISPTGHAYNFNIIKE